MNLNKNYTKLNTGIFLLIALFTIDIAAQENIIKYPSSNNQKIETNISIENSTKNDPIDVLAQEPINIPEDYALFIVGPETSPNPDIDNKYLIGAAKTIKRLHELNVQDDKIFMFYYNPDHIEELDSEHQKILNQKADNNTLFFNSDKETILKKVNEITSGLDENDTFLLYLTGHGALYSRYKIFNNTTQSCLMYQDSRPLKLRRPSISKEIDCIIIKASDIEQSISDSNAEKITIYVGSCFPGSFSGLAELGDNYVTIAAATETERAASSADESFGNMLFDKTKNIRKIEKAFRRAKKEYYKFQDKLRIYKHRSHPILLR